MSPSVRLSRPILGSRMKTQMSPTRMGAMIAGAKTSDRRIPPPAIARWRRSASAKDAGIRIARLTIRTSGEAQRVERLSGGNQQKVALARLLHQNVDVLLLDEPTRGVDVGSKVQIYELMGRLAAAGKAILFVSSYLPELLGVADRIAVMKRGVLGAARPAADLDEETIMRLATIGED